MLIGRPEPGSKPMIGTDSVDDPRCGVSRACDG